MKRKKTIIIALTIIIFAVLLFVAKSRSDLVRQLQGPIEGCDSILTINNNLSIISKSNHVYTWDWNNFRKWPLVAKPQTSAITPLSEDKVVFTRENLILTDMKAEKEIANLSLPYGCEVQKINVSRNGKKGLVLLSQKDNYKIATFDSDFKNLSVVFEKNINDDKCTIFDAAINDEGNLICVVGKKDKGWILVKDIKNDKILCEKTFDEYDQFTIVKFSPDDKTIYVAEKIRFILCMDSNIGNILRIYEMPLYNTPANQKQNISAIAISPNGKIFAADTEPARIVWFWDISTGKKINEIYANDFTVSDLAFSPDSNFFATGCLVRPEIKIWKVPTLK
jgi:WD40 repeat protein